MFLYQILGHRPKILRFTAIESRRFDGTFKILLSHRRKLVSSRIFGEKISSDNVDSLIRTLGRKNRRDQQLEGILKIKFAMCGGINFAQPLNNSLKSLFGSHLRNSGWHSIFCRYLNRSATQIQWDLVSAGFSGFPGCSGALSGSDDV